MTQSRGHGPHLVAAVFCDQVLDEKDNVLSAIRIHDRFELTRIRAQPGDEIPLPAKGRLGPPVITFTLLVILKSGDFKGRGKIGIVPSTPSGKILARQDVELEFLGGEYGANAIVRGGLPPNEEGIYWFDVYFEDRLLTSSPLRVRFAESDPPNKSVAPAEQSPEGQQRS